MYFFGHRKCSEEIEPALISTIEDLIENKNVDMFYVGNHGDFDRLVRKNLKILKEKYHHINYAVVLAYMPIKTNEYNVEDYSDTIYLDGLETTPPKFAINNRNIWMINESNFVVASLMSRI